MNSAKKQVWDNLEYVLWVQVRNQNVLIWAEVREHVLVKVWEAIRNHKETVKNQLIVQISTITKEQLKRPT